MIFEIENYLALRKAMDEFCDFLLAEQVEKERVFDSKLAVYELIGNVLKHSGGSATLHGEIVEERIRLKIVAEKPFCPPDTTNCADVFSENGRGLFLVDKLCEERIFTPQGELIIIIKTK